MHRLVAALVAVLAFTTLGMAQPVQKYYLQTAPSPGAISAPNSVIQTDSGGAVFASPNLAIGGALTATTLNGNTFTTGTYTLTGAAAKTLTFNNSLTLAGTDGTTQTFQASDTIVGRATTDILTNKTFDTAGTGNLFKINGTGISAITGSGSAVLATSPALVTPALGAATATSLSTGSASITNTTATTSATTGALLSVGGLGLKYGSSADSTSQPSGTWAAVLYNATNSSGFNGLFVKNNFATSASTVLEVGVDVVASAYVPILRVRGDNAILMPQVTTGTNADFACFAAGGLMQLQTSACTISSLRFKNLIGSYADNPLMMISGLSPIVFTRKRDREHPDPDRNAYEPQIGLSAENVAAIEPRCAIYEQDGRTPKSYRQECLIAVLVAGMQAQQREIAALKAR